ncbi:MAG: alanine--tRNA ligase [bacterium]
MKGQEIGSIFLKFFEGKGHKVCESKSLIPSDPSVLFTVAGMVPFKDYFLGNKPLEFSRAVSCQRCIRTNDLERVGKTARHLTFFEMLGNFSFGDYFKEDAIAWAWEFLTKEVSLPKDRLYVSVFKEDKEAEGIWKKFIEPSRIIRLGEEDNFWKMGETGPCGPCSEIIIDLGEDIGCKKPSCSPGCDCDRYLELYNLVFTEFDRQADGSLKPLSAKNIDTGMGLERLAMILQSKKAVFECDLIAPIIDYITESRIPNPESRIIADHIRAIAHLIYDGIIPSNEERGYVLRSLIRRAIRKLKTLKPKLKIKELFLWQIVYPVTKIFPYLEKEREHIANIIKLEEDKFDETMERGLLLLEEEISKSGEVFAGANLFKLYDTYGFPVDFAVEIIKEKGRFVDMEGFNKMMDSQRERGRKKAVFSQKQGGYNIKTEFIGYDMLEASCKVIKQDGLFVILDKTPFYPEMGGQVGDCGIFEKDGIKIYVEDTQRDGEAIIHKIREGNLLEGDIIQAAVDKERRDGIKRAHTATHLLQFALREILGKHIKQQGSLVERDRLRFDFNYPNKVSHSQIQEIEEMVYGMIMENLEVNILKDVPIKEAKDLGALAFFGDEYKELVRVVMIGDKSKELCGGCHIASTGKIGLFKIVKEEGVSAGIRRIEAFTGNLAYQHILKEKEGLLERIEALTEANKKQENKIRHLKYGVLKEGIKNIAPEKVGDISLVFEVFDSLSKDELSFSIDEIANAMDSGVILLGSKTKDSILWTCKVKGNLKPGADYIIKEVCKITGGGGGGRPDFATGGGKDPNKIDRARERVLELIGN